MTIYHFDPLRKIIEPGDYLATIKSVKEGETSSGDPQRQVVFELENGEFISDFILEIKKVHWKIQSLLYACNLKYEGEVEISDDWKEFIGKKIWIKIDSEEYKGVKRSKVKAYYRNKPVGKGSVNKKS